MNVGKECPCLKNALSKPQIDCTVCVCVCVCVFVWLLFFFGSKGTRWCVYGVDTLLMVKKKTRIGVSFPPLPVGHARALVLGRL